jgi:hypothetical protein
MAEKPETGRALAAARAVARTNLVACDEAGDLYSTIWRAFAAQERR